MTSTSVSDQSGFSLAGMLVVLAILAAGWVVASPYLAQARSALDTRRAADEVAAVLTEAGRLAVARTRPVRVTVDERNRTVAVEGGTWRKLAAGIALAGPAPGRDGSAAVTFLPDGTSTGGQVVVSVPGRAVSLVIEREGGRVRRVEALR